MTPRTALLAAVICLSLAGCGSSGSDGEADVVEAQSSASESVAAGADEEVVTPLDACALITAADVAPLIGATVDGVSSSVDPTMPGCVWENAQTYESVTITIGSPDSAPNNTLPRLGEPGFPEIESTPGPDGMRFVGGALEFAAANRYNSVQVASVSVAPEAANDAMIGLANKIAPQIPAQ